MNTLVQPLAAPPQPLQPLQPPECTIFYFNSNNFILGLSKKHHNTPVDSAVQAGPQRRESVLRLNV